MILVNYLAAVALFCTGLYAVLTRRNMIKMVMGLSLMEAATYLFMISLAYRSGSTAPVLLNPPPGKTAQDLVHGNVASLGVKTPLLNGPNDFLWTEMCWMLEG